MTKDELWDAYCARNPQFNEPGKQITLTSDGIKKLFEQTWDIAAEEAEAKAKAHAEWKAKIDSMMGRKSNPFGL